MSSHYIGHMASECVPIYVWYGDEVDEEAEGCDMKYAFGDDGTAKFLVWKYEKRAPDGRVLQVASINVYHFTCRRPLLFHQVYDILWATADAKVRGSPARKSPLATAGGSMKVVLGKLFGTGERQGIKRREAVDQREVGDMDVFIYALTTESSNTHDIHR